VVLNKSHWLEQLTVGNECELSGLGCKAENMLLVVVGYDINPLSLGYDFSWEFFVLCNGHMFDNWKV
jgi:hypothetical protein